MSKRETFFSKVGLVGTLLGTALLLLAVLSVVYVEGDQSQDRVIEEQNKLLTIKSQLTSLERRLLQARGRELLILEGQAFSHFEWRDELSRIISGSRSLAQEVKDPTISEPLEVMEKNMERYAVSVGESFTQHEMLDPQNRTGLLQALRRVEERITAHLAGIDSIQLDRSFTTMCLLERDFTNTLDMRTADSLKQKAEQFRDLLAQRKLPASNRKVFLQDVDRYREIVTEIMNEVIAIELQTAHSSLQFNRLTPTIEEVQRLLDARISMASARLNQIRKVALTKTMLAFGLVVIMLAALMVLINRNRQRTMKRLDQLAGAMEEVGKGNFEFGQPLPRGADKVGTLADQFLAMSRQIENQIQTIEREREKAEQANLTKDRFLANMSHEIRTPMNGVLGILELLESTQLDHQQLEYMRLLRSSGRALLKIINDILDYSKIEAGMLELDLQPFQPRLLIKEIMALHAPKIYEKQLHLNYEVCPDLPFFLNGDPHRLRQILNNILGNAIKFTAQGSIHLSTSLVNRTEDTVDVCFHISDTGCGMTRNTLSYIFEPFVQADAGTSRKYGGTGLGLAISKMLAERMSGKIAIESKPDQGTHVYITLPFELVSPQNEPKGPTLVKDDWQSSYHPKLEILVAEDNVVNQKVVRGMLDHMGFSTELAEDGEQAVEMARRKDYDLILMDIQMPHKNGLEATDEILSWHDRPKPVIVALTASVFEQDREHFLARGMHDLIQKPFKTDDLKRIIKRWGC